MPDRIVTRITALPKPATFKEAAKSVQRVAAYARVSTDHEEQETSLAAQTDYYRKKILEHPGWEFVEIYVDDGVSGLSTSRREGFNRMVEDCLALNSALCVNINKTEGCSATTVSPSTAEYAVLTHTDMPSILVETCFLTNQADAEKAITAEWCASMANAIASAIMAQYPIAG